MTFQKPQQSADFILDCSVTMAWCFEDEVTNYTENVFDSLINTKAMAPSLWTLEVANVLLIAQRKKRISRMKTIEFKDSLNLLPIQVDHTTGYRALSGIMELADETGLTIYDAAYLELAFHFSLPLATLDQALKKAAKKMNIEVYSP